MHVGVVQNQILELKQVLKALKKLIKCWLILNLTLNFVFFFQISSFVYVACKNTEFLKSSRSLVTPSYFFQDEEMDANTGGCDSIDSLCRSDLTGDKRRYYPGVNAFYLGSGRGPEISLD
jgi:hypothetical protein